MFLVFFVSSSWPIAPARAQSCRGEVVFRLWQPDRGVTSFELGREVEIETGREAHLYVHVRGSSTGSYATQASFGYPYEFGFVLREKEVLRHVRMEAQTDQDRLEGKIRFTAQEVGSTKIAYRIDDVPLPGRIDGVPPLCRVAEVTLKVLAPALPKIETRSPIQAAQDLLAMIERSFLGRGAGPIAPEQVAEVLKGGQATLARRAGEWLQSPEFRRAALVHLEKGRKKDPATARRTLLFDLYHGLYGPVEPDRGRIEEDLEDLEFCLASSDKKALATCSRFGRNLVNHPLFAGRNRALLERLSLAPP